MCLPDLTVAIVTGRASVNLASSSPAASADKGASARTATNIRSFQDPSRSISCTGGFLRTSEESSQSVFVRDSMSNSDSTCRGCPGPPDTAPCRRHGRAGEGDGDPSPVFLLGDVSVDFADIISAAQILLACCALLSRGHRILPPVATVDELGTEIRAQYFFSATSQAWRAIPLP